MHKLGILFVGLPFAYLPFVHSHSVGNLANNLEAISDTLNEDQTDRPSILTSCGNGSYGSSNAIGAVQAHTTATSDTIDPEQVQHATQLHRPPQPRSCKTPEEETLVWNQFTEHSILDHAKHDMKKVLRVDVPRVKKRENMDVNQKQDAESCRREGWLFSYVAQQHPTRMAGPFVALFMSNTVIWILVDRIVKLLRPSRKRKSERSSKFKRSMSGILRSTQDGYQGTRVRKAHFFRDLAMDGLMSYDKDYLESYSRCQTRLTEIDTLISGLTEPAVKVASRPWMIPRYLALLVIGAAVSASVFVVVLIPFAWNATYYCPEQVFFDPTGGIVFFAACLLSAAVPLVFSCFLLFEALRDVRRAKRTTRAVHRDKFTRGASRVVADASSQATEREEMAEHIPLQQASRIPTSTIRPVGNHSAVSRLSRPRHSMPAIRGPSVEPLGRPRPTAPLPRERLSTREATEAPRTRALLQYYHNDPPR